MNRIGISVVLCTYNGEKYIEKQLDSILAQLNKNDEIIIIDDCSVDSTYDILKRYEKDNSIIQLYRNNKNIGYLENFMNGLTLASKEIIFLSDQDDVWVDEKVKRILNVFKKNKNIKLVFTDAYLTDESGVIWSKSLWDTIRYSGRNTDNLFNILLKRNVATGATMAIKQEFIKKVLPVPDCWVHDGWFVLIAALSSSAYPINDKLIMYRQHANNVIGAKSRGLNASISRYLGAPQLIKQSISEKLNRYKSLKDYIYSNEIIIDQQSLINLDECIEFWNSRNSINSEGYFKGSLLILKNIVKGRYKRYATGINALIKDIYILYMKDKLTKF